MYIYDILSWYQEMFLLGNCLSQKKLGKQTDCLYWERESDAVPDVPWCPLVSVCLFITYWWLPQTPLETVPYSVVHSPPLHCTQVRIPCGCRRIPSRPLLYLSLGSNHRDSPLVSDRTFFFKNSLSNIDYCLPLYFW